jgi:hypothetical protein
VLENVCELELAFAHRLRDMLAKANFAPLSEVESENAAEHNFLSNVPIKPVWEPLEPIFRDYPAYAAAEEAKEGD